MCALPVGLLTWAKLLGFATDELSLRFGQTVADLLKITLVGWLLYKR